MRKSRVLLYDIETSPLIIYSWGIWETNAIKVIKESQILCFAYKWLDEKKVHTIGQDDFKSHKPGLNNDKDVVQALRDLFDEADVVIAHNGNSFDQKICQARMMKHNLAPPSPYKQIDTKLVAKRFGRFESNKLDDLGKTFSIGQKLETGGFATWEGCMAGDKKSWKKMKKYNKQDVVLLEEVYLRLRPWIVNHPGMNMLNEDSDGCPKCGSHKLQKRGFRITGTNVYQQVQCQACGGWSRLRLSDKSIKPTFVN